MWQTVAIAAAASAGTLILSGWFVLLLAAVAGFAGATRWAPLVNYRTRTRTLAIMALSFFGGTVLGPLIFALGWMLMQGATPYYCSSLPSPPASPGGGCDCSRTVIPAHAGIHVPLRLQSVAH